MVRLNQRAYEILAAEVERCGSADSVSKVQREIVLKRLGRVLEQPGPFLTEEELGDIILDLFPNFNRSTLKSAARANRTPVGTGKAVLNVGKTLVVGAVTLVGIVGGVWILNLPYPPIRGPVSRTIPLVLLPSFISMDHNYRKAIAFVEQADQLVNQATSNADLELGQTKVTAAQKHLDALPVWFLGYYPQFYCSWFACGWRFTLDEFEQARKQVARMDARLFQERNAQQQLQQVEQSLAEAKQAYQLATDTAGKAKALGQWQQAVDTMRTIPQPTLAGRSVQPKLAAAERDLQKVSGISSASTLVGNLMGAAQEFAKVAEQSSQGTAHSVTEWEEIQKQWAFAIDRLNRIDAKDPDYGAAQKLLATYERNLSNARIRLSQEQEAVQAFEAAQQMTQDLLASLPANGKPTNRTQVASQLQAILNQLRKVRSGTTVYPEAQNLTRSAQQKLKQL